MEQTIAIAGLGLIGGSFAKAIKRKTSLYILGFDVCQKAEEKALADGAIDSIGSWDALSKADTLYLALYPDSAN